MDSPVVVVPCSGTKLDRPAPARELYTGSYHRAAMRAGETLTAPGRIVILSGLHGLVGPWQVLAPYGQRIDQPGAIDVEQLARQVAARGMDRNPVVVLAGRIYADRLVQAGVTAVRPLDGTRGIGEQLARLAAIRTGQLAVV